KHMLARKEPHRPRERQLPARPSADHERSVDVGGYLDAADLLSETADRGSERSAVRLVELIPEPRDEVLVELECLVVASDLREAVGGVDGVGGCREQRPRTQEELDGLLAPAGFAQLVAEAEEVLGLLELRVRAGNELRKAGGCQQAVEFF